MLVIVCFFLTFYVVPSVLFLQLPHIDLKIRTAVGGHPEPTSAELTSFLFWALLSIRKRTSDLHNCGHTELSLQIFPVFTVSDYKNWTRFFPVFGTFHHSEQPYKHFKYET